MAERTKNRRKFQEKWFPSQGNLYATTNAGLTYALEQVGNMLATSLVRDGHEDDAKKAIAMLEDIAMVLEVDREVGGMNFPTKDVEDKGMTLKEFFNFLPGEVRVEFARLFKLSLAAPTREDLSKPNALEVLVSEDLRKKVAAIKLMRERTGNGLKDAKDAIEAITGDDVIRARATILTLDQKKKYDDIKSWQM